MSRSFVKKKGVHSPDISNNPKFVSRLSINYILDITARSYVPLSDFCNNSVVRFSTNVLS